MRLPGGPVLTAEFRTSAEMDRTESETARTGTVLESSALSSLAHSTLSIEEHMPEAMPTTQRHLVTESIDLGGYHLLDELNKPLVAARPKPRGLLPIPPEVEAAVADDDALLLEEHGLIPTSEDRQRQVNSQTLQYYYEGHDVAYRLTPLGVELLAVGLSEIRNLVQGMSPEDLLTLKIGQP
jgi:hypothetical protein